MTDIDKIIAGMTKEKMSPEILAAKPSARFVDVLKQPECASDILVAAMGCSREVAIGALRTLAKKGWVIAPRNQTNAMLAAYIKAYGQKPSRPFSYIVAIAKAKARWQAMALAGTKAALSRQRSTAQAKAARAALAFRNRIKEQDNAE